MLGRKMTMIMFATTRNVEEKTGEGAWATWAKIRSKLGGRPCHLWRLQVPSHPPQRFFLVRQAALRAQGYTQE